MSKVMVVPWDQASSGYIVPPGRYIFQLQEAEFAKSDDDVPKVKVKLVVLAPKERKGSTSYIHYKFNGPGLSALRELLTGLGIAVPQKAAQLNLKPLEGKRFIAEAGIREWNGMKFQTLANIQLHSSSPQPEPEPEPEPAMVGAAGDGLEDDFEL